MFSEIFERFIQNRPIAVMVRVLLESLLNADHLDRWFDTVRQSQYTKDILFSSIPAFRIKLSQILFSLPAAHPMHLGVGEYVTKDRPRYPTSLQRADKACNEFTGP